MIFLVKAVAKALPPEAAAMAAVEAEKALERVTSLLNTARVWLQCLQ